MAILNSPDPITAKKNALSLVISESVALATNVTYPTLSYLRNKRFARQKKLSWNADVGGAGVAIKDVVEDAVSSTQGSIEPADLPIGNTAITHTFDLDLSEVEQALATGVAAELRNLFQTHVNQGVTKMMRSMNRFIFNGDGNKPTARVIGLERVIDPTYAYAGIDGTVHEGWNSVVNDASDNVSLRDLSPELLRSMETAILMAETEYDLLIMSPLLVEKYKGIFDQRRSFQVAGNTSQQNADLGIADVSYNGRPILADPACTANTVYFVDSSNVFLHTYRVKDDAVLEGMAIKIGQLAQQNIYAEKWEIGIIPQLQVFNRKAVNALRRVR